MESTDNIPSEEVLWKILNIEAKDVTSYYSRFNIIICLQLKLTGTALRNRLWCIVLIRNLRIHRTYHGVASGKEFAPSTTIIPSRDIWRIS
jgi:hypothetical protein